MQSYTPSTQTPVHTQYSLISLYTIYEQAAIVYEECFTNISMYTLKMTVDGLQRDIKDCTKQAFGLLALHCSRLFLKKVKYADFIAIKADETTHISTHFKLVLVLQYIDNV